MELLSATDALGPALARTRRILFQPFRFSTFLKLCLVAAITEGMTGKSFRGSRYSVDSTHWDAAMWTWTPEHIAMCIGICLLVVLVCLAIFYLVVRLRFALFECLARQNTQLAPGWRTYRTQSRRFFWLSLVVGLCFVLVVIGAILPFVGPLVHVARDSHAAGHLLLPQLLSAMLPLLGVLAGLVVLAIAIDVILRDFMLPHIALDDDTAGEAWQEVWDRMTSEKGAFLLYGVLRVLLPICAAIGIFIVLAIPLIILFGVPGVMIGLLHAAAVNTGGWARVFLYLLEGFLVIVLFALGVLIAIAVGGPLGIAIREYALMFYGGRYKRLGDILSPPPAAPAPDVLGLA